MEHRRPGSRALIVSLALAAVAHSHAPALASPERSPALQSGPAAVDPNRWLGIDLQLPALDMAGDRTDCQTWIDIQNAGDDAAKALMLVWGDSGSCASPAVGPIAVECSGLIRPGASWRVPPGQIPAGSRSAFVLRYTADLLSEIGLDDDMGFDGVAADVMCQTLDHELSSRAPDVTSRNLRRLLEAYREGLDFAGLNQRLVTGRGTLTAQVIRSCQDGATGDHATTAYAGSSASSTSNYNPLRRGYLYALPLLKTAGPGDPPDSGASSWLQVQNAGLECAQVEVWLGGDDACAPARLCTRFSLPRAGSWRFDIADCAPYDWTGSAWLRSSQALAIVADLHDAGGLASYAATPLDAAPWRHIPGALPPSPTSWAPWVAKAAEGWTTRVRIFNPSERHPARAKLSFIDPSGHVRASLVDWLCPLGGRSFDLDRVADLPAGWQGSLRVTGHSGWDVHEPPLDPPYLMGTVQLRRLVADPGDPRRMLTYALDRPGPWFPPYEDIWPLQPAPTPEPPVPGRNIWPPRLVIPRLDDPDPSQPAQLTLLHAAESPGFIDLGIHIFDANGPLGQICTRLDAREQLRLGAVQLGFLPVGFRGSAVVSADYWEHDASDTPNWQALTAIVVGSETGPGDAGATGEGIWAAPAQAWQPSMSWASGGGGTARDTAWVLPACDD